MMEKISLNRLKSEKKNEKNLRTSVRLNSKHISSRPYGRHWSIAIALLLIAVAFSAAMITIPISKADTPTTSTPTWYGYDGSGAIYLTTDSALSSTNPYNPSVDYSSWNYRSVSGTPDPLYPGENFSVPANEVAVGVGGTLSSSSSIGQSYEEYYSSDNQKIVIEMPITEVGVSNWTHSYFGDSDYVNDYIDYGVISVNVSNSYPNSLSTLETGYDSGVNDSQTYTTGTMGISNSTMGWNTAWYLLSLASSLVPGGGDLVSTAQYEHSLWGTAGLQSNPGNFQSGPGNFSLAKFGLEHEMTQTGNGSYGSTWGYDTYALSTDIEIDINASDFANSGQFVVGAANTMENWIDEGLGFPSIVYTSVGAYSDLSINVVPAYTVQGTAYMNGVPFANQKLLVESPSGNYNVYTDSEGGYQFFAQPGVMSFLTTASTSIGGVQIDPPSYNVNGGTYNLYLTQQNFSESGLPSGTNWSIGFSGPELPSGNQEFYTGYSTTSTLSVSIAGNESYEYTVNAPSGYTASITSGNLNIGTSTPSTISISFSPTPTYTVTFQESGLPSGTEWNAKLDGVQHSSTSSTITFSSVPDGSTTWSVPYVYYSTTLWYEPTNGGGSFTLSGAKTIDVTFTGVPQSTTSCVYALAPVLLSNYTTQYAQSIKAGDNILTYNFSTGSLQQGTVQQVFITHHTEMYVINGYLKVAGDQDIWTNHGYIQAQNLTSNDTIYNVFDNHYHRVHSVSVEYGNFTMYDFYVTSNHNYIVWSNLMQDRLP